jgi:hypothetical protein
MTTTAVVPINQNLEAVEQALVRGNIGELSQQQRLTYYDALCKSLGLNPLTQPFEYLTLNGKVRLYAKKDATDQLRKLHGVSVVAMETQKVEDVHIVVVRVRDKEGREDIGTGAVPLGQLKGEALANALMKGETKAKRRATLSICGLGFLDETELETIPQPKPWETRNYEVNESTPAKCEKCEKDIVGITKPDGGKLNAAQAIAYSEKHHNASWCWECIISAGKPHAEPERTTEAANPVVLTAEQSSDVNRYGSAPVEDKRHPIVQEMAQRQAERDPDPCFIIDPLGKPVVAGTVTQISITAKSFQVHFGKERLSTFPNRSICEHLKGTKGKRVILEYSISGDGKYKNIESIRRIGEREFVDNVPAYQLNEDPDPVPSEMKQNVMDVPNDEELPF